MIELNDFELAIAEYIWQGCDIEAMMEDDLPREITKHAAAKVLALAKKELMKGAVEAHVWESCNPVSESPDKTYHMITIEYEDTNKDIPYVVAGQDIKLIILKDDEQEVHP